MYKMFIGIDPDTDKSGVAIWNGETMELRNMDVPELFDFLSENRDAKVIVEAGWLNKAHFHTRGGESIGVTAMKGNNVGRNQEVGRIIVKMCKHWGINVTEQRPLRKTWRGRDGKITHEELAYFVPNLPKRSNQETRDACLILWNFLGKPIRIKIKNAKL